MLLTIATNRTWSLLTGHTFDKDGLPLEDSINSLISVFDNPPRGVHNPLAGGTRRCVSHSIMIGVFG